MQFTEAGVSLSFEVTFDSPSLFVGMKIYDDSGVSPVLVSTQTMTHFYGNSYRAKFTASDAKSYLIHKAVYTDGTLTTLDSDYSQGSESIRADDLAGLVLNAMISSYQEIGSVGAAIEKSSLGSSQGTVVDGLIVSTLGAIIGNVVNSNVIEGEVVDSNTITGQIIGCGD